MTEPIELLEEKLKEIKLAKNEAEKNNLLIMDLEKIKNIYNRYYVAIEVLKRSIDNTFIDKGILYRTPIEVFHGQEKEIKRLKFTIGKLYREKKKENKNSLSN
jgi:hypothetical protein